MASKVERAAGCRVVGHDQDVPVVWSWISVGTREADVVDGQATAPPSSVALYATCALLPIATIRAPPPHNDVWE